MKLKKSLFLVALIFFIAYFVHFNFANTITYSKNVYADNYEVTEGDLAMLSALAYEDASKIDNSFSNIVGLSNDRIKTLSYSLNVKEEKGPSYYFLNNISKEDYDGWEINNSFNDNNINLGVITFKKQNNYVIAIKGTEYPELMEWLLNDNYIQQIKEQSKKIYEYSKTEYGRIIESDSNAKIYVTGHFIGGFLAQISGASIFEIDKSNKLDKVIYFNSMGIDFFGNFNINDTINIKNISEKLIDLATTSKYSKCPLVTWSDSECSSKRLILYKTENNPIALLGIHYGEVKELNSSIEAINNNSSNIVAELKGFEFSITSKETTEDKIATFINSTLENFNNTYDNKFNMKDGSFSEQLFTYVSNLSASLKNKAPVKTDNNDYPEGIDYKIDISSMSDLINNNLLKTKELSLNENMFEGVRISNETDSLTCIKKKEPTITYDVVGAKKTIDEDGIVIFHTNKDAQLNIITANGCSYDNLLLIKYFGHTKLSTINIKNPNSNRQESEPKEYRIITRYGFEVKNLKLNLDGGNWNYTVRNKEGNIGSKVKNEDNIIKIHFDNLPPIGGVGTLEVSIPKGETKKVEISSNEPVSSASFTSGDAWVELSRTNFVYDEEKGNYNATLHIKNNYPSIWLLNSKTKINGKITDYAGNTSSTIPITVNLQNR